VSGCALVLRSGRIAASGYHGFMDELQSVQELAKASSSVGWESKELAIRRGPLDVTQKQIDILKREIAHLEGILARSKSGGQNA
jgi:hypothetical protein